MDGEITGPSRGSAELEALLDDIARFCNPMVARWKMRRLHEFLRDHGSIRTVVEVGTGHGALTVLIADALVASKSNTVIYTFDRITGGSREAFGTFEENARIIRDNLSRFEVETRVRPVFGDVASTHAVVGPYDPIDLLVLDADGRIDRDLMIFWSRMEPGSLVVLDDAAGPLVAGVPSLLPQIIRGFRVDGKNHVTSHIERRLVADGHLEPIASLGDLHILRKRGSRDDELSASYFLDIYRSVIPAPVAFAGNRLAVVLPSILGFVLILVRRTRLGRWAYGRFRGRS